jgi:hypothetical protein
LAHDERHESASNFRVAVPDNTLSSKSKTRLWASDTCALILENQCSPQVFASMPRSFYVLWMLVILAALLAISSLFYQ